MATDREQGVRAVFVVVPLRGCIGVRGSGGWVGVLAELVFCGHVAHIVLSGLNILTKLTRGHVIAIHNIFQIFFRSTLTTNAQGATTRHIAF
ncbi:hypothetical protein BC936DRAFT_139673 [Jimgerdemannia flammicorona]|uniref:Uncharacterized protein n=1 Tax=Jimgerdemannia flammicorona TaxID=994334 RepID=A0A433B9G2_9FUNG|nr:hypothetical protein BC936DRAFT_139673 [Jimgerdemannia flammicorona]